MENDEVKYEIKTNVTLNEFIKFFKLFPRNYWINVLYFSIFYTVIIGLLSFLSKSNLIGFLIIDLIFVILTMIYCKAKIDLIAEKYYRKINKDKTIDNEYMIKFYSYFLEKISEHKTEKIEYNNIIKIIETDTNFYFRLTNRVIIVEKVNCSIQASNFIRQINKERYINKLGKNLPINKNYIANTRNSKLIKIIMIILFILTILSIFFAISTKEFISDYLDIHPFLDTKIMWIYWLWLPIPVLSIVLGFKYEYKKNIIAGFIIAFILIIAGSLCLSPTGETEYNKIEKYKEAINVNLPSTGTYIRQTSYDYYFNQNMDVISDNYVYFKGDEEGFTRFEYDIENNKNWIIGKDLDDSFKTFITDALGIIDTKYYLIYNDTTKEYNKLPENSGNYHIYSASYSQSGKILQIMDCNFNYIK